MILLTARDLARQFDVEPVFRNVTFDVRAGEKVGIVGPNGAGKSTLMRILAGLDDADIGEVQRPPQVRMAFLQQQNEFSPGHTLIEEVRSGLQHLYELQARSTEIAARMAEESTPAALEELHRQYDEIHHALDRLDAYQIDHRVDEVMQGLGFQAEDYDRPLSTFSGGQQNRAILARILLESPDLLLLDEPTNHLDIESTEWLEDFLQRTQQAVIVVSHDRYFLDRVTGRTLEIFRGGVDDYPGSFSKYWTLRDERHKVLRRAFEKQQEFIEKTEDFIRRNRYGQKHAQAKDREKKLERLERVELPPEFEEIPMGFPEPSRTGDWVFRTEQIAKGFPKPTGGPAAPLFQDVTLQVDRGDRVGILGPNGGGKTTLLKVLIGDLPPDEGKVRHGTGVEVAYFDQQLKGIPDDADAVDAVRPPNRPDVLPGALRNLLARFGIKGELSLQTVGAMSGGEKTKVALAKLAAQAPNVMVLDEPTNHLDFWACAALEKSLRDFPGTVMFVSHDRYFLDQIATRIIAIDRGALTSFEGNYSGYQHHIKLRSAPAVAASGAPSSAPSPSATVASPEPAEPQKTGKPRRKRKFPYRKVEELEQEIAHMESWVAQLEADMADPETHRNAERMRTIQQEYDDARSQVELLIEHWEEAVELN